jgi:hypothetical protein
MQALIQGIDNVFGISLGKNPVTVMEGIEIVQIRQKSDAESDVDQYNLTAEDYELKIQGEDEPLEIDYILKDGETYSLCVIQK